MSEDKSPEGVPEKIRERVERAAEELGHVCKTYTITKGEEKGDNMLDLLMEL